MVISIDNTYSKKIVTVQNYKWNNQECQWLQTVLWLKCNMQVTSHSQTLYSAAGLGSDSLL